MITLPWLEDRHFIFPDVSSALSEPDGLLAASEVLSAELVIEACRHGIFPWYSAGQPVLWWSPDPRCVLYPDKFHISRSFKRTLSRHPYTIRTDTAFKAVMQACAKPRAKQRGTWITQRMLEVYTQLHESGFAHSIEVWHEDNLVGGIYGLIMGDIFFGESMFSRRENASKIALHHVCSSIKPCLIDAQVCSEHLLSLGAEVMPRYDFSRLLKQRLARL